MSEKQTHRKLSGSVRLGQFSTHSGRKEIDKTDYKTKVNPAPSFMCADPCLQF
jgi:hypothetical protein